MIMQVTLTEYDLNVKGSRYFVDGKGEMIPLGIDVGSLNTKLVIFNNDKYISDIVPTPDRAEENGEMIGKAMRRIGCKSVSELNIVSTGIGGKSIQYPNQGKGLTTCLALGMRYLLPSVRLIVDLGAESINVVGLNKMGMPYKLVKQDKCASGTGMFLQQTAKIMGISLEEMASLQINAESKVEITNTCVVFAESEIISYLHGRSICSKEQIVAGVYCSIASTIIGLCKKVDIDDGDIAVTGGVALNRSFIRVLEHEMGRNIFVPADPHIVPALGAALIARKI